MGRKKLAIDWSAQPLGEEPDSTIAARLGCSAPVVRRAREAAGLPLFGRIDWASEPLGVESDGVIARRLGCSPEAVFYARKQRGIPAVNQQRPDCDPDVFHAELGTCSDRLIAERHGLSRGQVRHARDKAGIPPKRIDWSKVDGLGTRPDCEFAELYGVDNSSVATARRALGIPAWTEERKCPCGDTFHARHRRQRFCRFRCQRYHWQMVNRHGKEPEAADLAIALWAYKRTLARKGKKDVE